MEAGISVSPFATGSHRIEGESQYGVAEFHVAVVE